MQPLNILIWPIHGAYLTAIAQAEYHWYVPTKPGGPEGYIGRGQDSTMPSCVREVPAEEVATWLWISNCSIGCVIYWTTRTKRNGLIAAQQESPDS